MASLVVAIEVAASTSARADEPTQEARLANQHALELDADGKYAEALASFQRAYDLSPTFRILYNIARTARLTQDFARSLLAYKAFLRDGADKVDPDQRAIAEREIADLSGLVGWVTVKAPADATVTIDAQPAAADASAPLNPGAHTISAKRDAESESTDIVVVAGKTREVAFELKPHEVTPPPTPKRSVSTLTLAAWAATGLFTTTAIITGVSALVVSRDLSNDVYVGPAQTPAPGTPIADKSERVRDLGIATDVFIGLSVASGIGAITVTMIDALSSGDPAPKRASNAPLELAITPGRIALRGRF